MTTVAVAGGSTAAAEEPERLTGDDPAHANGEVAAPSAIVPLPELAITHRLANGGMNLWRMPLSELEDGYGQPQLVKKLDYGGFSYDNSWTLPGDIADVTPSDDGTADFAIWHAQPNGGVLLWAVGGGGDTTPEIWQDLRAGGWRWVSTIPRLGDVTGDGWDDLYVEHWAPDADYRWVLRSDGSTLLAPEQEAYRGSGIFTSRKTLADFNGDGVEDKLYIWGPESDNLPDGVALGYTVSSADVTLDDYEWVFDGPSSAGWSYANSRQVTGDVTGDGLTDILTIHAQGGGGILVWVHANCWSGTYFCFEEPEIWQDLRTGGWSYAGSRQHMADTDGDGTSDLVSVHSQSGNPGMLVWRHRSTSSTLTSPSILADLKTGGWSYSSSREAVADTYGEFTP